MLYFLMTSSTEPDEPCLYLLSMARHTEVPCQRSFGEDPRPGSDEESSRIAEGGACQGLVSGRVDLAGPVNWMFDNQ